MSATPTVIKGIVRGGVVVFDPPATIPEGTEVQVTVPILEFTPEERAEYESLVAAANVIALLQAKARASLPNPSAA